MKIQGKITDKSDGSALAFANVYVSDKDGKLTGKGTQSTLSGFYSLESIPDNAYVTASYLGYDRLTYSYADLSLNANFALKPNVTSLKEIIVTAPKKKNKYIFLLISLGILGILGFVGYKKLKK